MKVIWILPIIGALLGALVFVLTIGSAKGAPQEAAGFAMAMALAVIPYVLVRAVQAMSTSSLEDDTRRVARATEHMAGTTKPPK